MNIPEFILFALMAGFLALLLPFLGEKVANLPNKSHAFGFRRFYRKL